MLPLTLVSWISGSLKKVARKPFWPLLLGVLFAYVVFINGISLIPYQEYQRLSENPFVTRTDIGLQNYWQETVLLPVMAHYAHLTTYQLFNILCLSLIFIAYLLFSFRVYRKFGPYLAIIFTTLLITSPLTTILLSWLGSPDALSFLLTISFLFSQSGILIFLFSMLGTMNHVVVAIAAGEILLLRWISRDTVETMHLLASVLGGVIGFFLVKAFIFLHKIQIFSRVDYMFSKQISTWFEMNFRNFPMTTFSLFNIQWLILVICILMFFAKDRRYYVAVMLILLINYGITFFVSDTTRIFALLSWGVFFQCVFYSYQLSTESVGSIDYREKFIQAITLIGVLSIISPRFYSWEGNIHPTPFYESLERLVRWLKN